MRKYAWIYVIVTVIALIWGVRYFTNKPVETQIAMAVDYENSVSASAVLVRNETVYKTEAGGSLQPQVFDETRVSKGTKIASIYTDGIESSLKAEIDAIDEKIAKLEASSSQAEVFGNDIASVETRIKSNIAELVGMSISEDMSSLDIVTGELEELVGEQKQISGDGSPRQLALKDLYAQKREAEGRINSARKDIYASCAGVYISGTDGCEQMLTPEYVMNLGVEEFSALNIAKRNTPKDNYNAGEYVCKIVDNDKWYAAAVVSGKLMYGAKKGDSVKLRLPELSSDTVNGTIESISEEKDGSVLVVVSSGNYVKNVYSERTAALDIILDTYSGLQLPLTAVRVDGDETGVFINTDGVARFRKIDILYKNDELAIVKKSTENGYLKMYDQVIVNGKDIEQGKLVNN